MGRAAIKICLFYFPSGIHSATRPNPGDSSKTSSRYLCIVHCAVFQLRISELPTRSLPAQTCHILGPQHQLKHLIPLMSDVVTMNPLRLCSTFTDTGMLFCIIKKNNIIFTFFYIKTEQLKNSYTRTYECSTCFALACAAMKKLDTNSVTENNHIEQLHQKELKGL